MKAASPILPQIQRPVSCLMMGVAPLTLPVAVAALGGALAVPSTRRLVLGEVKHDWIQDELDLDHIAGDGATIVNKDGTHSRAWRLRGLSYDAKIEQE
ncbi:hypothetical protein, partial [Rhodospirillum sp. A1_3_36]|uniref:hypothetical protein n=1 Tax=Rhodospirillum sp. A1_3_36 TaxID=3391666 RepID=UPI0039A77201